MDKTTLVIVAVSFIILIGGAFVFANVQGGNNDEGVVLTEKVKGNKEATVTLAEYSDFQCPACASFEPALAEVMDDYGEQLRFEYHHFPLISIHPSAELAARASEAAGVQGKFWEFHNLLFANQQAWSSNINPRNQFIAYAEELGLDTDMFTRHLNSNLIRDAVQEDMREGRTLGITGTPTFFLNGERMEITTFDDFRAQIEVALGVRDDEAPAASAETDVEFSF